MSSAEKRSRRVPQFECQECGKLFYSAAAAERAAFGDEGCPQCGSSDIDLPRELTRQTSRKWEGGA
jgi:hypothetical protein